MPSIEKHVEISKQRTGKAYHQVHEWIDDPQHKEEDVQVLVDKTLAYFGAKKQQEKPQ